MFAPFIFVTGIIRKTFMLCPWIEAVTKRVPVGSKHSAERGLVWALNCAITTLVSKSRTVTYSKWVYWINHSISVFYDMPKKVKIYIVWGFPLSLNIPCLYHIIPSLSGFICNEYYNGNLVYALEPLYYIHTCIVTHQSTYKSVMVYMCPHIYRTRALS